MACCEFLTLLINYCKCVLKTYTVTVLAGGALLKRLQFGTNNAKRDYGGHKSNTSLSVGREEITVNG